MTPSATTSGSQPAPESFGEALSRQFSTSEGLRHAPLEVLKGAGKGALNTTLNLGGLLTNWAVSPQQKEKADATQARLTKPAAGLQQLGYGGEQAAEFLAPGGLEDEAVEKAGALGKATPWIGRFAKPAARIGAGALSTGAVEKLHGGSFKQGAEMGAAGTGVGEMAKAVAPGLAESALGITRRQRGFGRTPGEAVLNDIKWKVSPGEISNAASGKISELTADLEHRAAQAGYLGRQASTAPALRVIDDEMAKARARNAEGYYRQLEAMRNRLTTHFDTGQPIPQQVSPTEILDLKRGVDDLEKSWNPDQRGVGKGTVRRVHRALDDELDRTVPKAKEINQRISSLIPARARAASEERGPGLGQRVSHRMAAHTGAMAGSLAGGLGGYQKGGAPGAAAGAVLGAVLPEVATSSPVEMFLARAANRAGRPIARTLTGLAADQSQRR